MEEIIALNEYRKEQREARFKRFETELFPKLYKLGIIYRHHNDGYGVYTTKYGRLDFYPKADKVLIRENNKWIRDGYKFLSKLVREIENV